MDDDIFERIPRERAAARAMLRREMAIGTEWTSDGCGYNCAIVPDTEQPDKIRIIWYDERGPLGHATREPGEAVIEEIIANFGTKIRRCDGEFNRITLALAAKETA